jgi:hypothetical protein
MGNLEEYLAQLEQTTISDFNTHLNMLYIQAKSWTKKLTNGDIVKVLSSKDIEDYLRKRGYTMNYVLGKCVMVKGFTCVAVNLNCIEIWHDKANNNRSVYVEDSYLTGLPITLDYMERI